jgi:hypothetical protein
MKMNDIVLLNTNITLKEFKELLYNKFKAYPTMITDYKNNTFLIRNTFYDGIDITQRKLQMACNELGISYKNSINSVYIKLIKD